MAIAECPRTLGCRRGAVALLPSVAVLAAVCFAGGLVDDSRGRGSERGERPDFHLVASDEPREGATQPGEGVAGAEAAETRAEGPEDEGEANEAVGEADSDPGDRAVVFLPDPLPLGEPGRGMDSPRAGGLFGEGGFDPDAQGEATPPNAALDDVDGRLARLRKSRDAIAREIAAAERERDAIVEPLVPADAWAEILRQRVESLDEDEALQAGRALVRSLMRRIGGTRSVVIEEGVARAVDGEKLRVMAGRKEVRQSDRFWYHAEPIRCSPAVAARLTAIVIDPTNLAGPGGGKFCGGFHPDLRLDYRDAGVTVLVCFGCRDIRYQTIDSTVTFDLTEASLEQFRGIARDVFRHRQFDDASERP